jgi:hypothetical protein
LEISTISNLSHLFLYILCVFIIFRLKIIPSWIALYLTILATSPYWFNGLLFSPDYMPDQFRYLSDIESIRNFDFAPDSTNTVYFASLILSLFPLPFVTDVIGVAFINKFIFLILFVYLYNKRYLQGFPLYFILLYPDLIMYSSLALRDILILVFMIVGGILIINKKYLFSFLILLPLIVLKFQNFFLMLILLFLHIFFMKNKFIYSKNVNFYFFIFLITLIFISLIILPYAIEPLNFYRRALFIEDGGSIEEFIPLQNFNDFFFMGIKNTFYFLLKPFFFEATNSFQLIQSFVNMIVFIALIRFTIVCYQINKFKTLFWITFLIISMTVYGLVVSNFGTAARYRFPFIVLYIIALSIDVYKNNNMFKIGIRSKD